MERLQDVPNMLRSKVLYEVRANQLVQTKYKFDPLWDVGSYVLAPLDHVSLWNGLMKWYHPYGFVPRDDFQLVLQWLHLLYGSAMVTNVWNHKRICLEMDGTKAAGSPYRYIYGPKKSQTLEVYSEVDFIYDFEHYTHWADATLKDELRVPGKDARLFVPANICMVYMGYKLFGQQNYNIMDLHTSHPIKIGLQTPHGDAFAFWNYLYSLTGEFHQFDGAQSDCHFAPFLAIMIREFRKSYLPKKYHYWVDRYYDLTYNMYVHADNFIFNVVGQQTGQVNTAADNSLGYLIMLMLHAVRYGITYDQFKQNYFAILGDDMLICDSLKIYRPSLMDKTWTRSGMYLESPSEFEKFEDMTFMGMHPQFRDYHGKTYLLYTWRIDRLRDSVNFVKKEATVGQRLSKLVSLCNLLFADVKSFEELRRLIYVFIYSNRSSFNAQELEFVGMLSDEWNFCLLTSFEANKF